MGESPAVTVMAVTTVVVPSVDTATVVAVEIVTVVVSVVISVAAVAAVFHVAGVAVATVPRYVPDRRNGPSVEVAGGNVTVANVPAGVATEIVEPSHTCHAAVGYGALIPMTIICEDSDPGAKIQFAPFHWYRWK